VRKLFQAQLRHEKGDITVHSLCFATILVIYCRYAFQRRDNASTVHQVIHVFIAFERTSNIVHRCVVVKLNTLDDKPRPKLFLQCV
jgi:hypothetical protein